MSIEHYYFRKIINVDNSWLCVGPPFMPHPIS